jgi:hypothetical protein
MSFSGGNCMNRRADETERVFSIELKSGASLKTLSIVNGSREGVVLEGTLGRLLRATFEEGLILEVTGEKGTLRLNLELRELKSASKNSSLQNHAHGR